MKLLKKRGVLNSQTLQKC